MANDNRYDIGKKFKDSAEDIYQKSKAADWAILKAEEFQDKFLLSNSHIERFSVFLLNASKMDLIFKRDRIVAELTKEYFLALSKIDSDYRKKENDLLNQKRDELIHGEK